MFYILLRGGVLIPNDQSHWPRLNNVDDVDFRDEEEGKDNLQVYFAWLIQLIGALVWHFRRECRSLSSLVVLTLAT
jgi:hypothetical protein